MNDAGNDILDTLKPKAIALGKATQNLEDVTDALVKLMYENLEGNNCGFINSLFFTFHFKPLHRSTSERM